MRYALWLLLLFAVAVVAAVMLGNNDGVVVIAWRGWRVDVSLNLFLLVLVASCVTLVMAIQAIDSLISLPRRAHQWRVMRRERAAQNFLRDALAEHFAGRYRRAQKAAQRSAAILDDTPELDADARSRMLAHLLSAASAHKLQDRAGRDRHVARLQGLSMSTAVGQGSAAVEGAKLLQVEWALDDRDASKALELLSSLPPGAARRMQALRLELQARQLERQPLEALRAARLLAKHQGFAPHVARSLVRSLVSDALDDARDIDQLKAVWSRLEQIERADPFVASSAARAAASMGDVVTARAWIEPCWTRLAELTDDEREAVALALTHASHEAESEWLARVEDAWRDHAQDPSVAAAAGAVFAERRLWGKARPALEQAAKAMTLTDDDRRRAWRSLAQLARAQGDEARAHHCDHAAAQLVAG
jgi:HemY protein